MLIVALMLGFQDAPIPMTLPQPLGSTTTTQVTCDRHEFQITIENRGFVSTLKQATRDGAPIAFSSRDGEKMHEVLSRMHSVVVRVGTCGDGGVLGVYLDGVNLKKGSPSFGQEVVIGFASEAEGASRP